MTAKEAARLEQLQTRDKISKHVKEVSGCWIWTGPVSWSPKYPQRTYGYVVLEGKKVSARRASYQAFGVSPKMGDHVVGCTCEERLCVNPKHLYLKEQNKSSGRNGKGK